jgi:cytoplasmic iron level regulating protein YaaA (DUF328/UPF0246 family)
MSLFEESLYKVWEKSFGEWFEKEDLIIDLASAEFSKLVKGNKISIEFVQIVEGKEKIIAYHSKQGRGYMLHYLILNQVKTIEEIQLFDQEGYHYEKALSSKEKLVFIRPLSLKK